MAMCKVSTTVHFSSRQSVVGERPAHWVPNTDIYATDEGLVIKMELAGMRSENLQITVEGNQLCISGQRPDGCRAAKVSFLAMEINYGPFENVLELPAGYDLTQAKASYLNGFLRIDVPHAEKPTLKRTKVAVTGK
ncbi:MAG TPA: Hsp20/alpha crystallin family protein [Verrucomicrobiae bacterium]|jgi:HSP20 family protein|nr:Hsp20/alpha crystallin family protein [Verrucomicrobiae bacterium]